MRRAPLRPCRALGYMPASSNATHSGKSVLQASLRCRRIVCLRGRQCRRKATRHRALRIYLQLLAPSLCCRRVVQFGACQLRPEQRATTTCAINGFGLRQVSLPPPHRAFRRTSVLCSNAHLNAPSQAAKSVAAILRRASASAAPCARWQPPVCSKLLPLLGCARQHTQATSKGDAPLQAAHSNAVVLWRVFAAAARSACVPVGLCCCHAAAGLGGSKRHRKHDASFRATHSVAAVLRQAPAAVALCVWGHTSVVSRAAPSRAVRAVAGTLR